MVDNTLVVDLFVTINQLIQAVGLTVVTVVTVGLTVVVVVTVGSTVVVVVTVGSTVVVVVVGLTVVVVVTVGSSVVVVVVGLTVVVVFPQGRTGPSGGRALADAHLQHRRLRLAGPGRRLPRSLGRSVAVPLRAGLTAVPHSRVQPQRRRAAGSPRRPPRLARTHRRTLRRRRARRLHQSLRSPDSAGV